MPRKSAIIYPKDIGFLMVWGDIYPGATVLESGLGSGSLTLALLRAVGPTGQVIVYEQRADMIPPALLNIRGFASPSEIGGPAGDDQLDTLADIEALEPLDDDAVSHPSKLIVRNRDIYEGIEETEVDRMVLDLAEPWRVLPHALDALRPGAVLACYSPSIIQVQRTVEALVETRAFAQTETLEVLYRPWHLKGQAVRPVQQMVSHTAFLTFTRRLDKRGRRLGDVDPVADDDADELPAELVAAVTDDELADLETMDV
jgi:tRNA (adenine57-N1/adenine58-N1)-methyltransferase